MYLKKLRDIRNQLPRARATIYDEINRGLFPKPIKVGRNSYWTDDEIDQMMAAYRAGATEQELRALCDAIHQQRKGG